MNIAVTDIETRLPRPLEEHEKARVAQLIEDSYELIDIEFGRRGKDFAACLNSQRWLSRAARFVVLDMVSAAVIMGNHIGMTNAASTTGVVSDSAGFRESAQDAVSFGGVRLTDEHLEKLGLKGEAGARGRFPPAARWPSAPLGLGGNQCSELKAWQFTLRVNVRVSTRAAAPYSRHLERLSHVSLPRRVMKPLKPMAWYRAIFPNCRLSPRRAPL